MGFETQFRFTCSVYDWVNEREQSSTKEEDFSKCSIAKSCKYFVASMAHVGMLALTPLWVAIDIILALAFVLAAIFCRNPDCLKDVPESFFEATIGNCSMALLHVLGIILPVVTDRIFHAIPKDEKNNFLIQWDSPKA